MHTGSQRQAAGYRESDNDLTKVRKYANIRGYDKDRQNKAHSKHTVLGNRRRELLKTNIQKR